MFTAYFWRRSLLSFMATTVVIVFIQTNIRRKAFYTGECSLDAINSFPLEQNDSCVVGIVRAKFLRPPSSLKLRLEHPKVEDPSMGQTNSVVNILKNKKGGFFVECGALDGETRSNTLYLERKLGWTGMLIEADPLNFKKILQKNRKTWAVPACLSKTRSPYVVTVEQMNATANGTHSVDIQCLPIYSILKAANRTSIDYLSLDVQGDELAVLKTIPWNKVISVELIHSKESKEEIRSFMARQGYEVITELTHPLRLIDDYIFAVHSLVPLRVEHMANGTHH